MWKRNIIPSTLEGIQKWTWSIDSRNRVVSCKRDDWRLLDEDFESKPIKRGGKIPFWQLTKQLES